MWLKSLRSSTKTILYLIVLQYFFRPTHFLCFLQGNYNERYKARLVKRPLKQRAFANVKDNVCCSPTNLKGKESVFFCAYKHDLISANKMIIVANKQERKEALIVLSVINRFFSQFFTIVFWNFLLWSPLHPKGEFICIGCVKLSHSLAAIFYCV